MQSPTTSPNVPGAELEFAQTLPPEPGRTIEVAPGILWARMALPFLLDHVNIYFVDDGDGWALIDTGLGNKKTQAAWQPLLDDLLANRPLTRIIATHFHPDHVGAAGFLLRRFDVPLYMSATEYLQSLNLHLDPGALEAVHYRRFYLDHGLDAATTQLVVTSGHAYLKLMSGLSPTYHRVVAGDVLSRVGCVICDGAVSGNGIGFLCRQTRLPGVLNGYFINLHARTFTHHPLLFVRVQGDLVGFVFLDDFAFVERSGFISLLFQEFVNVLADVNEILIRGDALTRTPA